MKGEPQEGPARRRIERELTLKERQVLDKELEEVCYVYPKRSKAKGAKKSYSILSLFQYRVSKKVVKSFFANAALRKAFNLALPFTMRLLHQTYRTQADRECLQKFLDEMLP